MRIWIRNELRKIDDHLVSFLKLVTARAEREIEYIVPGYTHLRRAQPARWSHCMLPKASPFPLDCCALAGNPFGIDRDMMAEELGSEGLLWNSMGGVADRDFAIVFLQSGNAYSTGSFLMPQKKTAGSLEAAASPSLMAIPMNEFSYKKIKTIDKRFEEDIADVFNLKTSVESRTVKGGTSKATVLEQIHVSRRSCSRGR
ncbi:hypothetical protein ACHAPJ_009581 [Fusarium lateritium]